MSLFFAVAAPLGQGNPLGLPPIPAGIQSGLLALLQPILHLGASLLLAVSALLWLECVAAWAPQRSRPAPGQRNSPPPPEAARPSLAVLVPAHNEAAVIGPTLAAIQAQLQPSDRLWVIADNCTDDTAALARQAGATVWQRQDSQRRGKGYALDYGLAQLAADPPQVVILVDADSQVHPGAVAALARAAQVHQRPIQADYYMTVPGESGPQVPGDGPAGPSLKASLKASLKDRVTAFATRVKNGVRLQGLSNLGLPCLLTGSGMAFPWAVLQQVDLASGDLVEDMKLGFDLAIAGSPPRFCAEAQVTAELPQLQAAAQSQRTRWEHGRLDLTRRYWSKLMVQGLVRRRWGLIALALDLCVLPLSLLVTLWLGGTALGLAWGGWTGLWGPAIVLGIAGGLLLSAIGLSWLRVGRQILPLNQLLLIPAFILWKLPIYLRFLTRPQRGWVRTDRDRA